MTGLLALFCLLMISVCGIMQVMLIGVGLTFLATGALAVVKLSDLMVLSWLDVSIPVLVLFSAWVLLMLGVIVLRIGLNS